MEGRVIMKQLKLPNDIRWIGPERKTEGFPIETTYFRTVFNLTEKPSMAEILISASDRYTLFVNGHELLNGPCRGDYWHQFTDNVDIASYLQSGENIVAAKVVSFHPYEATRDDLTNSGPFWAMSDAAGPLLYMQGELEGADISTGRAKWEFLNDSAINWNMMYAAFWMGAAEDVDGAKLPTGWESNPTTPGFAPVLEKWHNGIAYGERPPLLLHERPIDHLLRIEKSLDCNETIAPNSKHEFVLDTKELTTAFIYLRVKGGKGSKITMTYAESYIKSDGSPRGYKDVRSDASGTISGIHDTYRPAGSGVEVYSPSWFRTFRFVKVEVETGEETLEILPFKYVETRYPLDDKVQFNAPQDWVSKVWGISRRTLELCMHETYEDCPYFEQLQYTLDTRLQILFTYAISGSTTMAKKTLHDYHTSILPEGILQSRFPSKYHQIIPQFSLHWILMLRDFYVQTGDLETLERYRPTVENIFGWYRRHTGAEGLVEFLHYWDFADWVSDWDDIAGSARASKFGPSTIQNLVYAYVLETGAQIMEDLSLNDLAKKYRAERATILAKVEELCWDADRNLYREGPNFSAEYTQHSQMWAVLNGIATGSRAKDIMTAALTDNTLLPCSFVMQYFLFRALEEADMYAETETLWPKWQELLALDLTTVPEIPGKYTRSDCHAWGALLLYELPRKFAGVMPLEPGYTKIRIQPKALFLGEFEGTVPTPVGDVYVKWQLNDGKFNIWVKTPVEAEIVLQNGDICAVKGEVTLNCDVK